MKRTILALALTALTALTGCRDAGTPYSPEPISFAGQPSLRLNVAQINVVEQFRPTFAAPYVEHEMPTPPVEAVKQWAGQRLAAVGSQGTLEIIIEDASVKETDLKKTGGLFTNNETERYDAHLAVTMKLYDGVNVISMAEGNVEISKMQTITENTTAAQRERIFHDMVAQMMTQFNQQAEMRLRQYFSNYLS